MGECLPKHFWPTWTKPRGQGSATQVPSPYPKAAAPALLVREKLALGVSLQALAALALAPFRRATGSGAGLALFHGLILELSRLALPLGALRGRVFLRFVPRQVGGAPALLVPGKPFPKAGAAGTRGLQLWSWSSWSFLRTCLPPPPANVRVADWAPSVLRLSLSPYADLRRASSSRTTSSSPILMFEVKDTAGTVVPIVSRAVHLAPPCRSFTRARNDRRDGGPGRIRSDAKPARWGPVAEEGNLLALRAEAFAEEQEKGGRLFTIERPLRSYMCGTSSRSRSAGMRGGACFWLWVGPQEAHRHPHER